MEEKISIWTDKYVKEKLEKIIISRMCIFLLFK